jgi:predicted regulator of Ras-like GTPase activity (Roadblock/LC7/MglB family)
MMVSTRELDERIEKCQKILAENPTSQIFAALAEALRRKGLLDKAFEVCTRGLKAHSNYGTARLVMAKINFDRGMYQEAEKELLLAIKYEGKNRATDMLQAEVYLKKKEYNNAKVILERLKFSDIGNEQVKKLLKELYQKIEFKEQETTKKMIVGWDTISRSGAKIELTEKKIPLLEGLNFICSLPRVLAALVVGADGLIVESKLMVDLDENSLAAVSGVIYEEINSHLPKLEFNAFEQTLLETEDLSINVWKLKKNILVVIFTPEANLGFLRMKIGDIALYLEET